MDRITKLHYHVHKILPLVYDDSLSYYELLAKVVRKINDIIEIVAGDEGVIRDEIDKWLEAHPEAYSTTDYTKTDRIFETALDMIADETLEDGFYVRTCGYHVYGDGGGYFYKVETEAADGCVNIELANGLYAVMQDVGYYTPQMFGAIYDDNTISVREANTIALQNAVNMACADQKPVILDGNLAIYDTVTADDHLHMYSKGFTLSNDRFGSSQYNINDLFGYALITATDKKDLIFDGIRFEGSGHSIYDAKAVEIQGSVMTWTGWGAGLGLARCADIEVKNCRFFKCGGFGHYSASTDTWDYTGFAIWLSCCHDAIINGNIIECSHNGICVDRWFSDTENNYYNYNVTISDNVLHTLSGDAVVYEGNGDNCNLLISNNQGYNIRRRFIAGSRVWGAVIDSNNFTNDPALRQSPADEYGLTGSGWEWDVSQLLYPAVRMTGSFIKDVVINGNIFNYATQGIQVAAGYNITVTGNSFKEIEGINVILSGAADSYATAYGNFVIANNSFLSGATGVQCTNNNYANIQMNNINIVGNTNKAARLANIQHGNNVVIKDNTGGAPSTLTSCENIELSGYVVPALDDTLNVTVGDQLTSCAGVVINEVIGTGIHSLYLANTTDISGRIKCDNATIALIFIPQSAADVTGFLAVDYRGSNNPGWMTQVASGLLLDIYSAEKPTSTRISNGSTWHRGFGSGTPAANDPLVCCYYGSAWNNVIVAP